MSRRGSINWGVAGRIAPGETESGDFHVVHEYTGGVLMAAMDGLGHGPEAARASRLCASILMEYSGEPLDEIVARCHARLRATRGVTLGVCTLDEKASTWSWVCVGDITGMLLRILGEERRPREFFPQRNGVVGGHMPKLAVSTVPAVPGDLVILTTDGVRISFSNGLDWAGTPQQVAERILGTHANGKDDALALVIRYTGGKP